MPAQQPDRAVVEGKGVGWRQSTTRSFAVLRRNGPNFLQRQLRLEILIQLVVVREESLQELLLHFHPVFGSFYQRYRGIE